MSNRFKFKEMLVGGIKFFKYLLTGGLFNINLEVTKRCNAQCDFCDYWKESSPPEIKDYVPQYHIFCSHSGLTFEQK